MFMIIFVLHDTEKLEDVLDAWENNCVGGITILASTGLNRFRKHHALREDLPLIPSLRDILTHEESLNRTLMTLVQDEETVERVVQATINITGELSNPNTGVLAVLPVYKLYGA